VVGDDGYEQNGRVLKLTVCGDVYDEMTAPVGSTGRKRTECRQASDWIESRLDGRVYDFVKLYRAVPGFYESAEWTVFECNGYQAVGAEGRDYVVQNYGEKEGFRLVFRGLVWEIFLGVVVCRRTLHYQELPSKRQSINVDVDKIATKIAKLSDRLEKHLTAGKTPTSSPTTPAPAASLSVADLAGLMKQRDTHNEIMMKEFASTMKAFAPSQSADAGPIARTYSVAELREFQCLFQGK